MIPLVKDLVEVIFHYQNQLKTIHLYLNQKQIEDGKLLGSTKEFLTSLKVQRKGHLGDCLTDSLRGLLIPSSGPLTATKTGSRFLLGVEL